MSPSFHTRFALLPSSEFLIVSDRSRSPPIAPAPSSPLRKRMTFAASVWPAPAAPPETHVRTLAVARYGQSWLLLAVVNSITSALCTNLSPLVSIQVRMRRQVTPACDELQLSPGSV